MLREGTVEDITDRKVAEERVQFLAYYDGLTGLPNRTLLQDRLAKALAGARRHKQKVALLFLDLDRFKDINDSFGHSVGDLLLQAVAERLKTWAREQDTVARLSGDEFVLMLTHLKDVPDAAVAAERLMAAITADFVVQGHTLNVGCSVGISIFPEHGMNAETLIKNADAAMYSAKVHGRNSFRVLYGGHECSGRGAIDLGEKFAAGTRQERTLSGVSAPDGYRYWKHHWAGSTAPLAASEIGPCATRQVHTNC